MNLGLTWPYDELQKRFSLWIKRKLAPEFSDQLQIQLFSVEAKN
jgi:hypothetical protein